MVASKSQDQGESHESLPLMRMLDAKYGPLYGSSVSPMSINSAGDDLVMPHLRQQQQQQQREHRSGGHLLFTSDDLFDQDQRQQHHLSGTGARKQGYETLL